LKRRRIRAFAPDGNLDRSLPDGMDRRCDTAAGGSRGAGLCRPIIGEDQPLCPPDGQVWRREAGTRKVFKYKPLGKNRFRDKVTLEDGVITGWDQK